MDSPDQGMRSASEGATKNHLVTFPYEAKGKSYVLGIRPPTTERTPAGRMLSVFQIEAEGRDKPVGSISGYLSEEGGLKVLDVDLIGNHTAFVNRPPHKPNMLHVEDRTESNPNYIPRLIPNVIKQMLQAGVIDVWYSSNIRKTERNDADDSDYWYVSTISDDARFMYDVSLRELGLQVEEVDRRTQDYTGRFVDIKSYKVTLPKEH